MVSKDQSGGLRLKTSSNSKIFQVTEFGLIFIVRAIFTTLICRKKIQQHSLISRNSGIEIIAIIMIMIMIIFILCLFGADFKGACCFLWRRIFVAAPPAKKLCFAIMLTFYLNSFIILWHFSCWRSKRVRPYCGCGAQKLAACCQAFCTNEKSHKDKILIAARFGTARTFGAPFVKWTWKIDETVYPEIGTVVWIFDLEIFKKTYFEILMRASFNFYGNVQGL